MSDINNYDDHGAKIAAKDAEIERLRKALRPFAALPVLALGQYQRHPEITVFAINDVGFTANDVLAAKQLLDDENT
jgi:hypothetical protein